MFIQGWTADARRPAPYRGTGLHISADRLRLRTACGYRSPTTDRAGPTLSAGRGRTLIPGLIAIAAIVLSTKPGTISYICELSDSMLPQTTTVTAPVTMPIRPHISEPPGNNVGHVVRIYGNVDGTVLTYPDGKPDPAAPDMINAGDVVQIPALPTGQPAAPATVANSWRA